MPIDIRSVESLTREQFRRLGIAFCYRLGCDRNDKRLAKALKRLEKSLGPPPNEKFRREAFNAANSAYLDLCRKNGKTSYVACTLVCACWDGPTPNLLGNFITALVENESLSHGQAREIGSQILSSVLEG